MAGDDDRWGRGAWTWRADPRDGPLTARSDTRIREDVCEALRLDGWVDATDIDVRVEGQHVTLGGEVDDREQKWRAEDLVEHLHGVRAVINRIRVRRLPLLVPPALAERSKGGNGQRLG